MTEPIIDLHARWMADVGRAKSTIATRRRTLIDLARYGDLLTLTPDDVDRWWHDRANVIHRGEIKAASRNTRIVDAAHVRAFYKWAVKCDHITPNPARRLEPPKRRKGTPRPMPDDDIRRALVDAPTHITRAIALGAFAGLRMMEAARLEWTEVDLERRQLIVVEGKGGKDRTIGISDELAEALEEQDGRYVVHRAGQPFTPNALSHAVNRWLEGRKITWRAHSLRHRFGTVTHDEVHDLQVVGELMGHSSPDVTSGYARASSELSKRAVIAAGRLR